MASVGSVGPVAVVTGAGSGIGQAAAIALSAQGYYLVLAGRTAQTLATVQRELSGPGQVLVLDVAAPAAAAAAIADLAATLGRIDLLVNNAGTFGRSTPIEEVSESAWRDVIDTNLTGAFLCAQAAFIAMKNQRPQGGRIINIGSVSAHTPRPQAIAYTASKHAITGLTKALSLEGREFSIACGQLDIGNAATALLTGIGVGDHGALQADGSTRPEPTMDVSEVATAIVAMAALPLSTNIATMTIMATAMPFVGRG